MKSVATYRCRYCLTVFERTYNVVPNAAFHYVSSHTAAHICDVFKPEDDRKAPLGYGVAEVISIRRHGA